MSFAAKSKPVSGPFGRPGIRTSTWVQKALRECRSGAGAVIVTLRSRRRWRAVGMNTADDDVTVRQHFGRRELRDRLHEHAERVQQFAEPLDRLPLGAVQGGILRR